ncbi:MAG: 2-C-methyl-D-erythritol 2,4-cyclodiphosphate synthase [bacterium]
MRVGFGYDVHKLVKGRKLILGGVEIKFKKGLAGYSDADVLVHAVIDSLIGAIGEHDIGFHFPTDDPRTKGISSLIMLERIAELLKSKGFTIVNVDATVVAEAPKISSYVREMRMNVSSVLGIPENCVNVKGKTEEGLGFTGKGQGIAAYAVSLVEGNILQYASNLFKR